MLSKTVYLVHLQVQCPEGDAELTKIAGQLRNLFYAYSFIWCNGNLGRIIPKLTYDAFLKEFEALRDTFLERGNLDKHKVELTVIPFPDGDQEALKNAPAFVNFAVEGKFAMRLIMLQEALIREKKFYSSLLEGLREIIEVGMYLRKSINPKLISRLEKAQARILCHSAEDIRSSTALREEIISICGGLL